VGWTPAREHGTDGWTHRTKADLVRSALVLKIAWMEEVPVVQEAGPSRWAVRRFGERDAAALWRLVPRAMAVAVNRQIETHVASGLETLHAYGGAWPAQFEELVNHVGGLAGVHLVRPAALPVQLAVVNGSLLVPFRYAADLTTQLTDRRVTERLNKTRRALLGRDRKSGV